MHKQYALLNEHTTFSQKQIYLNIEMNKGARLVVEQVHFPGCDKVDHTTLNGSLYFTEEQATKPRNRMRTES